MSIGWSMSATSNIGSKALNPIYDFKGQVALVTGAAKGMGLGYSADVCRERRLRGAR